MDHRGLEVRCGGWSDGIRSSTLFPLPELGGEASGDCFVPVRAIACSSTMPVRDAARGCTPPVLSLSVTLRTLPRGARAVCISFQ